MNDNSQAIVISLGGSLIHPSGGVNVAFLSEFNKLIRNEVKQGRRFIIVCGGGRLSRIYQLAAKEVVGELPDEDIDWLGIHATKMNAQLLRTLFADITIPRVVFKYDDLPSVDKPVVICAGWKPGWSTDYCAVLLAREYNAKTIINLSNIQMVYDKDPKKYSDAKPLKQINWDDFQKIVGNTWSPGANLPFDPIATKLARALKLKVYIMDGSNLANIENVLKNKPFKGTIIMPSKTDTSFYSEEYFELGIGYKGYTTTKKGKFRSHLANLYRALVIKLFLRPQSLLDIGCATGLLVYYLRKLGIDAWGMDVSSYALSRAYPGIKPYLKEGSIFDIPFASKQFDVVTSFNVLEHLEENQIPKALIEASRVRKHYCLHKVYTIENKWIDKYYGDDFSRITLHPREWWTKLFTKEGYKQIPLFFPRLPLYMETIFLMDKVRDYDHKNGRRDLIRKGNSSHAA